MTCTSFSFVLAQLRELSRKIYRICSASSRILHGCSVRKFNCVSLKYMFQCLYAAIIRGPTGVLMYMTRMHGDDDVRLIFNIGISPASVEIMHICFIPHSSDMTHCRRWAPSSRMMVIYPAAAAADVMYIYQPPPHAVWSILGC